MPRPTPSNRPAPAPTLAAVLERPVVGTYPTHGAAQRAVDHLATHEFPVERVAIIGTDLRMVETVLGRVTRGRATAAGAATGVWFGSFVGILLSLFTKSHSAPLALMLGGALYGAAFGAAYGLMAHATTRGRESGRHEFTSRSTVVAARYDVVADAEAAEDARNLLIKLAWREEP